MNEREIEEKAKTLEKEAENGHTDQIADELHNMNSQDRIAVANKIKEHQQARPSDPLPRLDFYDNSGDLKSVQEKSNLETTVTNYDQGTGNKTSIHTDKWDGQRVDQQFDVTTENLVQKVVATPGKPSVMDTYDPRTGEFESELIMNQDGSLERFVQPPGDGPMYEIDYNPEHRVVAARGTDYRSRGFHYDGNGELDQIDGHLGHWDRTVNEKGEVSWKNKNTGAEWNGSLTVDADGNLHYTPNKKNGQAWEFTRDGQDVRR